MERSSAGRLSSGSASMEETFHGGGLTSSRTAARVGWNSYVRPSKAGASRHKHKIRSSGFTARLQNDYPSTNRGRSMKLWGLWQTPFNHAGELLPTLEVMVAVVAFVRSSLVPMWATCCYSVHLFAAMK